MTICTYCHAETGHHHWCRRVEVLTRTERYAHVNGILYAERGTIKGHDRMYADELNRFEDHCPNFDQLTDDERATALRAWRELSAAPTGDVPKTAEDVMHQMKCPPHLRLGLP